MFAALALFSMAKAGTWAVMQRNGAGQTVPAYVSSLAQGERGIGAIRSGVFELDADIVSFEICGADGWPGQRRYLNWFALCDAETGLAIRRVAPPGQPTMVPVRWDLLEFIGQRVYFRAVDAIDDRAFAWLGWGNVRVGQRAVLPVLAPGRLPDGWREELPPDGVSTAAWLACEPASARWAVERDKGAPTWQVMTANGVNQTVAPYLSSLHGGEQGTGAVRSPAFILTEPTYTFLGMGADSPTGDAGLNSFQLVDADSLEILRRARTHVGNTLLPIEWDTADLLGRKVFFRAEDNNDAAAWAWLGCDRVPLGNGAVATFADPESVVGWREEGQPEGAHLGAAPAVPTTLREMVQAEWRNQDESEGIRWSLWERSRKAAPFLMRRLIVVMDGDFSQAEHLLRDYRQADMPRSDMQGLETHLEDIRARMRQATQRPEDHTAWRALRLEQQRRVRQLAFLNPLLDFHGVLFVERFTQKTYADINVNHHAWGSRPGGDICVAQMPWALGPTDAPEAEIDVVRLLAGRLGPGNVHGIDLDWDASRIVFAYARAESDQPPKAWLSRQATFELHRTVGLLHLYEMNRDGSDLRQLTDGQWSDLNPCYLPSGEIAFESERCGYELQCNECDKDEPTTNLYAMRKDGSGIRRLAVTKDGDWYPRVLQDGSIVYSHWEYHERSLMFMHPLWVIRPDGTGADAFAKQHFNYPLTLTAPRPVPGSRKVMAIGAGHHTLAAGPIVLIDVRRGGNSSPESLTRVTGPSVWPELGGPAPEPGIPGWRCPPGDGWYMDPFPLSETTFLVAYCPGAMQDETGYGLYLANVYGGRELLFRSPAISAVMPIPLKPRKRPLIVPDVCDQERQDAVCVVMDVTDGVPEIAAGVAQAIRIAEPVGWPFSNETGGQRYEEDAKSMGVNWTPVAILGTVPVEPDGSASFRVPADRALYFQLLDARGMELRRMRTYVSFQPGETRGCSGCHETQPRAPRSLRGPPLALRRAASVPEPPPWGAAPISFLRDVQPLLTRHCGRCHTGLKPAGGVDLAPGLTQHHNRAYESLVAPEAKLLSLSSKGTDARVTPVKAVGSHQSRLVEVLTSSHRNRCRLPDQDWRRLFTWIDANAVYHDGFIRKRPARKSPYRLVEDSNLWTEIGAVHARRCVSCHEGVTLARLEWVDLDNPEDSLFLRAPLARTETPSGKSCQPFVYADANDPDYRTVLSLLRDAAHRAWEEPRRDLRCLVDGRKGRTGLFSPERGPLAEKP